MVTVSVSAAGMALTVTAAVRARKVQHDVRQILVFMPSRMAMIGTTTVRVVRVAAYHEARNSKA